MAIEAANNFHAGGQFQSIEGTSEIASVGMKAGTLTRASAGRFTWLLNDQLGSDGAYAAGSAIGATGKPLNLAVLVGPPGASQQVGIFCDDEDGVAVDPAFCAFGVHRFNTTR